MCQPYQHILLVLSNLGNISFLTIESGVDEGCELAKNIDLDFEFVYTLFVFGIDFVLVFG